MIDVDLIAQKRRAYFDQRRSIKEIVRLLSVSRATVRKVTRIANIPQSRLHELLPWNWKAQSARLEA